MEQSRTKFPRIPHFSFSPGIGDDDIVAKKHDLLYNDEVVVTEKMDGECVPSTSKILLADGTQTTIGKLVRGHRTDVYVLGVNETGQVVPSKILNTFYNGTREEPWLRIRLKGPRGHSQCVVCTANHKILTQRGYVEARDVLLSDKCYTHDHSLNLTNIQKQVLLGKLLGDGSFHKKQEHGWTDNRKALVSFSHKKEHEGYVLWTQEWLGGLFKNRCIDVSKRYGNTEMIKGWTAQTNEIFETFNSMFASGRKTVPSDFIDMTTPITLAFWYMDDGNLSHTEKQKDRMVFSVCGFDDDSCVILQKMLLKYNVSSTLHNFKGRRYLYINHLNSEILASLIAPYVCESMRYKLPNPHRFEKTILPPVETNVVSYRLMEMSIKSIEPKHENRYMGKYDIETETHNYFVNGTLVHNCTTMYNDYVHARSTTFTPHPSRSWIKRYWAENIAGRLAADMRICGENMYAKHSIHYKDLPTYFLVFGIWEGNFYVSWNDVVEYCQLFDLTPAPLLYRGFYDDEMVKAVAEQVISRGGEGVVVRSASGFDLSSFETSVFKYVREGHVQTDEHWMNKPVTPNELRK